jgi:alcohol dehydrogenase, propanol-preferring
MLAARLHQPGGPVVIEETPKPVPGEGEVLVRIEACGLCHSDLFIRSLDALPKTPLTLGHEAVGVVEEAASGVAGWRPGDRVALTYLYAGCGACEACLQARPELCPRQINTGYHADGAFAEYAVARATSLVRAPPELPADQAAPLCCAGWTAYHAVDSAGLDPGSWLAIFGAGGLGHLGIQFARLRGLRVVAVDLSEEKLALARKLGAEITVNAREQSAVRALKKVGGAHGAISFVASASVIGDAFKSLRRLGVLVLVGLAIENYELPLLDTVLKQVRIQGSFLGTRAELGEVFGLARAGKVRMETETMGLEALPGAMERMKAGQLTGRAVVGFPAG